MINWRRMLNVRATIVLAFAVLLTSCSDDRVAGGTTEDAGLAIKNLDVAGLAQKGPFVKGSAVTVQGIDCQTMELTHEIFEGSVKSDKGDYDVSSINLSSPCAVFEVSGYYLNEVTGAKSADVVTLQAITNLKDRKNVNVNVLTSLEYGRVKVLATEMSFAEAKKQAEKEVLMSFGVAGAMEANLKFEDLNIFEKGNENATLWRWVFSCKAMEIWACLQNAWKSLSMTLHKTANGMIAKRKLKLLNGLLRRRRAVS